MCFRGGINDDVERGSEKFEWRNRERGLPNMMGDLKTQIKKFE